MRIREQHHQPVNSDSLARRRRQRMAESADVVRVDLFRRFLPTLLHLRAKTPLLIDRIIQLREAIGKLHARDEELKTLRERWVVFAALRKRRNIGRKIVDERRL